MLSFSHFRSMDLHNFNGSPGEVLQGEDLNPTFKISDSCGLLLDPFQSDHHIEDGVSVLQQSAHEDKQTLSNLGSNTSHVETSSTSHQFEESNISLSSHIFTENEVSAPAGTGQPNANNTKSPQDRYKVSFEKDSGENEVSHGNTPLLSNSIEECSLLESNHSQHSKSEDSIFDNIVNIAAKVAEEIMLTCSFCPKVCRTQELMLKHESLHIYKTSAIQCSKCGYVYWLCTRVSYALNL